MLPANARRHHVTDTLAAACRRDEQDMLGSVMEHDFVIEWIPADDKTGLLGSKTGFFDVGCFGKIRCPVRTHADHAAVNLIADKDPQTVNDPRHIEILSYGYLDCVKKFFVCTPQVNGKRLKNVPVYTSGQEIMIIQRIGNYLCCCPVPDNVRNSENGNADQEEF